MLLLGVLTLVSILRVCLAAVAGYAMMPPASGQGHPPPLMNPAYGAAGAGSIFPPQPQPMYPQNSMNGLNARSGQQNHHLAHHQIQQDYLIDPRMHQPPTSFAQPQPPFFNPQQQQMHGSPFLDPNLLLKMHPSQMSVFGVWDSNACSQLSPTHFAYSAVNPTILSYMKGPCLRALSPTVFAGMTQDQIGAIGEWEWATPKQIAAIPATHVHRITWSRLGPYPQYSGMDSTHPCYGVTAWQRAALSFHPQANTAYHARCKVPNGAAAAGACLKDKSFWASVCLPTVLGLVLVSLL